MNNTQKFVIMPSDKSDSIESAIYSMTRKDRRATILERSCMTCDGDAIEFRDDLSRKEYSISGMCQKCQDSVFGS